MLAVVKPPMPPEGDLPCGGGGGLLFSIFNLQYFNLDIVATHDDGAILLGEERARERPLMVIWP